jgi:hypothetical protein
MAPGYSIVISHPMCLDVMTSKLIKYKALSEFEDDLKLMLDNCVLFNQPDSFLPKLAINLWTNWRENRMEVFLGKHELIKQKRRLPPSRKTVNDDDGGDPMPRKKKFKVEDDESEGELDFADDESDDEPASRKKTKSVVPAKATPATAKKSIAKPLPKSGATTQLETGSEQKKGISGQKRPRSGPAILPPPPSIAAGKRAQELGVDDFGKGEIVSWAALIVKDEELQRLLRSFLSTQLASLCMKGLLPLDHQQTKDALHLIQFGLNYEPSFEELNPSLLRHAIPLVMYAELQLDSSEEDRARQQLENCSNGFVYNPDLTRSMISDLASGLHQQIVKSSKQQR